MLRTLLPLLALLSASTSLHAMADFAGPNQNICGTNAVMAAFPLGAGESGLWTVVQGTAQFTSATAPTSAVTGLSFGENILRWTVFSSSGTASDVVSIWCYNMTMPPADAGPDQTTSTWPGTVQLSGSQPVAPGTCFWTVLSGTATIANPNDPNTMVSGLGEGVTVLHWSCNNGPCGTSDDVMSINAIVGVTEQAAPAFDLTFDASSRTVRIGANNTVAELRLFDMQGQLVRSARMASGGGTWMLGELAGGAYSLQAAGDGTIQVLRLVVQ